MSAFEKLSAEQAADREDEIELFIPAGRPLGDLVVEAEGVSKSFGDKMLIENFSFRLPPGGIVGIIGPNGAGKTTLFRMLVGLEKPDSGVIRIGPTVDIGYVDQNRDALDATKTVYEEISGGYDTIELGKRTINSRSYVAKFNFMGPDQQKKTGTLSGGERIACILENSFVAVRICCFSMNRRMISTLIRCVLSKKVLPTLLVASL